MEGVDGDDVGVLHLRQRLRLAALDRRHLQHHRPACEVGLLGQEDAGEGAATELLAEAEVEDLVA